MAVTSELAKSAAGPSDSAKVEVEKRRFGATRAAVICYGLVLMGGVLLALLAIPARVTTDGYFYLQNSMVLFTDAMGDVYWWIREPGYPLFLWGTRGLLGNSDIWLSLLQGGALVGSVALAVGAVWRKSIPWIVVGVVAVALLNPGYMAYSGLVLQQPLIVLVIALAGFLCFCAWSPVSAHVWRYAAGISLLTPVAALIAIQLGVVVVATSLVMGIGLFFNSGKRAGSSTVRQRLVAPLLALALSVGTFVAVSVGWSEVKESANVNASVAGGGPVNKSATDVVVGTSLDLGYRWQLFTASLPKLLSWTESTPGGVATYENQVFGGSAIDRNRRCGTWDFTGWESAFQVDIQGSGLAMSCRGKIPNAAYSTYPQRAIGPLMALASASLLLGMIVALFRRHWAVLMAGAPVVMFVGMYAVVGSAIDRYALPIYPFGVAFAAYLLSAGWLWVRGRRNKPEVDIVAAGEPRES